MIKEVKVLLIVFMICVPTCLSIAITYNLTYKMMEDRPYRFEGLSEDLEKYYFFGWIVELDQEDSNIEVCINYENNTLTFEVFGGRFHQVEIIPYEINYFICYSGIVSNYQCYRFLKISNVRRFTFTNIAFWRVVK